MRYTVVVLALMLVGTTPAASQVTDDRTVVPGVRIGRWALTIPLPELLRTIGPPSPRPSLLAAVVYGVTWYSWDHLGLAVGTTDRNTIAYLAVYQTRDYVTPRGAGVGVSRTVVLGSYGDPTVESDFFAQGRTITVLAYDKIGLAFFLHNDVVQVLLIFNPGGLQHLIANC